MRYEVHKVHHGAPTQLINPVPTVLSQVGACRAHIFIWGRKPESLDKPEMVPALDASVAG